jgi:hypothetical protein
LADRGWRTGVGGPGLADRGWRTGVGGPGLADWGWRTGVGGLGLAECSAERAVFAGKPVECCCRCPWIGVLGSACFGWKSWVGRVAWRVDTGLVGLGGLGGLGLVGEIGLPRLEEMR